MVREEQILLVREREDGGWTMPGGWADVGESPSAMVVREMKEESGYDVVPRKAGSGLRPQQTSSSAAADPRLQALLLYAI